ncbi:hypothetical protein RJG79_00635 [Mycoplasmatota bacterium WC44]
MRSEYVLSEIKESKNKHKIKLSGPPVLPKDRVKNYSDGEFEDFIKEWALGHLSSKYSDVKHIGGANDKGRDVIGIMDDSEVEIFQCKHYNSKLTPSNMYVEFGKLCYYTWKEVYKVPKTYYIVSVNGLGKKLEDMLSDSDSIRTELINNWDKYCKEKITKVEQIELKGELKNHVETFDFSIIKELSIDKVITEHLSTPYAKYRFGGGVSKERKKHSVEIITKEDMTQKYITKLLEVYSEKTKKEIKNIEDIEISNLMSNFELQRKRFYSAEALRLYARDEFVNEEYNDLLEEIYSAIYEVIHEDYGVGFDRLSATMRFVVTINLNSNPFERMLILNTIDRQGICHQLADCNRIGWVKT